MTTQQSTQRRLIGKCEKCGNELPLRHPVADEPSREWMCSGCDAAYDAVLIPNAPPHQRRNIMPTMLEFDRSKLDESAEAMMTFLRAFRNRSLEITEKRDSNRHALAVPVLAMPVDAQFQPTGNTEMMVSRNISTCGIALLHTRAIDAQFLAIEIATPKKPPMQLVMEVVRCRPLGPYMDIAGRFVTKMGMNDVGSN